MIVGALMALFLTPLFMAGGVVVVVVGLVAAVLAAVACRRPRGGLVYPVVVVVPVVVVPQEMAWPVQELMPPATPQWTVTSAEANDCPTATPSDWVAWSAEIQRRCGTH